MPELAGNRLLSQIRDCGEFGVNGLILTGDLAEAVLFDLLQVVRTRPCEALSG